MAYEIIITSPGDVLEASFFPTQGMVGTSLRHHGEELLHQGHGLAAYVQHGSVFALPLLHPWANRLSAWEFELAGQRVTLDPDSPITHRDAPTGTAIHGLLAACPYWTVTDAGGDSLTAELDFAAVPEYMAAFPFAHRLRYAATVSDAALTVALTVASTGERPVPVSFGFHPYLTLPGSNRRDWQIQIPAARQTLVDERMIPTGETVEIAPGELDGALGERTFDANFDRLRDGDGSVGGRGAGGGGRGGADPPPRPAFVVADGHRRITLTHTEGYPVGQVFAPEDSDFICCEPMTAPVNALISGDGLGWVAPGAEHTAIFTISVE